MLQKLKKQPLLTSLLIVVLYALWFIVPMLYKGIDPNAKGINGIDGALSMWSSEVITAIVLIIILSILGWWENIGFQKIKKGGVKFLLPMIIIALIIIDLAWVSDESGKWFIGFDSPLQLLSLLGVIVLLGFVEEGIFRGILFYGFKTKFTPFFTVTLTSLIFGIFHFVNLFEGAEFNATLYQAIHAGAMGFLYASLRLKIGAIWPLMLIHGFWDFSIFVLQSTLITNTTGELSATQGLSVSVPALVYGIFIYWSWYRKQYQN